MSTQSIRMILLLALMSCRASNPTPLRILQVQPGGEATPGDVITVTFDRPAVVSLDDAVDPSRIVRINPPIDARIDWRDPSTIRVVPSQPLIPGTTYTLTVDTVFAAAGGARLPGPERVRIHVRGPRRLASIPMLAPNGTTSLDPQGELQLLYSAPVDSALLGRVVRFEANGPGACAGTSISYQVKAQRPPGEDEYWPRREERRGSEAAGFERVVQLAPTRPLPEGCEGVLVIPSLDSLDAPELRYRMSSAAPFAVHLVRCPYDDCLLTPSLYLAFSGPVRREELETRITFEPPDLFRPVWSTWSGRILQVESRLVPRSTYRIVVDTSLRDAYGRRLTGSGVVELRTGDMRPGLGHFVGMQTLSRGAPAALRLRHVNVDSVELEIFPVDDTTRTRLLTDIRARASTEWSGTETVRRMVGLPGSPNETRISEVALPELAEGFRNRLVAVRLRARRILARPDTADAAEPMVSVMPRERDMLPTSVVLVQYTDLMVHAAVGEREGAVFVTHAGTGAPVGGATVRLVDAQGDIWANGTTDGTGVASLSPTRPAPPLPDGSEQSDYYYYGAWGARQPVGLRLVEVSTADDRALLPVQSGYGQYGTAEGVGVLGESWATRALATRAMVFTDRDIYRPGEMLYGAAILREGPLDSVRVPDGPARVRWRVRLYSTVEHRWTTVQEREGELSSFGAAADSFRLPPAARLGSYQLEVAMHRDGSWRPVNAAPFSVAEYRAPEFVVDLKADSVIRFLGDTGRARVSARFLFDAPMGHAPVTWSASFEQLHPWELQIRNLPPGFQVGDAGTWWMPREAVMGTYDTGTDTLDATGVMELRVPTDGTGHTRGARLHYTVSVADVSRQVVTASASQVLHGSTFYLAVRDSGTGYWWTAGARQRLEVMALRPDGQRVTGIRVRTALLRALWRRQELQGQPTGAWGWHVDTLRIDSLVTADTAVKLSVTATEPGYHALVMTAEDESLRPVRSSVGKWVTGGQGFRWGDTPTRLDMVLSTDQARSGDTTIVAFTSPFDSAEVWVTAERERVLWQHRMTVGIGTYTVPMPVTDELVPDVTVSVLLVNRDDVAALDSLHHRVRYGSADLNVDVAPRRLTVSVRPERPEYEPSDSAVVFVDVRDSRGRKTPAALALWAVDEGVLSLTGYERPDPVEWLFPNEGPSLLHGSTLMSLRAGDPQVFLRRMLGFDIFGRPDVNRLSEVVVTGVASASATRRLAFTVAKAPSSALRQDFRTTAFFRAFVTSDDSGHARVVVKLPDNVTTFRLITVALSSTDKFGSGESPLIATKPLIVRAALPRFARPGDEFTAGGVVNARDARSRAVDVRATAEGMELLTNSIQRITLKASGTEARFGWRVPRGDSTRVQLEATDGILADRVSVNVPIQPDFSPRAHTLSGVVRRSASVVFVLPPEIDPARSRLTVRVGLSPMPTIQVAGTYLRAYPYLCTEQLTSVGRWLVAMLTLHDRGAADVRDVSGYRTELQRVVDLLQRRQTQGGGFGYWSTESWTSPWLSARVGMLLLDARDLGATVSESAITALGADLARSLDTIPALPGITYGARVERWQTSAARLADRVAAARYLARAKETRAWEEASRLLSAADQMWWEDRVELAHLLHLMNRKAEAQPLLMRAWEPVKLVGNRIELPDSLVGTGLFASRMRPAARLLSATLAIEPSHPGIGALVESIVQRSRPERTWRWNTQDHASAAAALAEATTRQRGRIAHLQFRSARAGLTSRQLVRLRSEGGAVADTTIGLSGLVELRGDSAILRLSVASNGPVYYALTVDEVPLSRPLRPDARGISVERWYERFDDGRPVTELVEGELVRVRLRVTVPGDREFVAVEDPLPAGLEAVDLSLRTSATLRPFASPESDSAEARRDMEAMGTSHFGRWYGGWWSPWEHSEIRDDRVLYFARRLWTGSYTASYVARATTSGRFVRPPAHAEEMYNPVVNGRSEGGPFRVAEGRKRPD
jgi:uncharacterized protein YfaS (alpha-2-macroglobulin family)